MSWKIILVFSIQVEYLASRKPSSVNVTNFFSYLFSDDALMHYNFSGANNVGDQKMPMKNYSIFTDCMIGNRECRAFVNFILIIFVLQRPGVNKD